MPEVVVLPGLAGDGLPGGDRVTVDEDFYGADVAGEAPGVAAAGLGVVGGKGGRRQVHCRREIVDAIFYVVDNGSKWRAFPADFPPWSTVYHYFAAWAKAGITVAMLDVLRDRARLRDGRTANPSAGIIDSQSVTAAETVGRSSRRYDAGKKINGRKRHIVTGTLGLLLCVSVTAASVQDRDAGRTLLKHLAT